MYLPRSTSISRSHLSLYSRKFLFHAGTRGALLADLFPIAFPGRMIVEISLVARHYFYYPTSASTGAIFRDSCFPPPRRIANCFLAKWCILAIVNLIPFILFVASDVKICSSTTDNASPIPFRRSLASSNATTFALDSVQNVFHPIPMKGDSSQRVAPTASFKIAFKSRE